MRQSFSRPCAILDDLMGLNQICILSVSVKILAWMVIVDKLKVYPVIAPLIFKFLHFGLSYLNIHCDGVANACDIISSWMIEILTVDFVSFLVKGVNVIFLSSCLNL